MQYQPTLESVSQHPVPTWFHNAKLGIFIHWGLYSVPAWAPNSGDLGEVIESGNWADWFTVNAYAEWYANTYRIPGSPTQRHHFATYGHGHAYRDFVGPFNEGAEEWDPNSWADLFKEVGARYVVLTTKHHDGFLLWPSRTPNPYLEGYHARRDLCGELAQAVRGRGLTMAYYYSGGVDWTFTPQVIRSRMDLRAACPQSPEYVAYADAHWRELVDRYETAILWNDIGWPRHHNTNQLFADYYNAMPDGLVNNRFGQIFDASGASQLAPVHHDFTTPEYQQYDSIQEKKWESCRGIGASFGYNRQEGVDQYLSAEALIRSFIDIVSKNGNLLINVGPTADGRIPPMQAERLRSLGTWLAGNGEAIFDSRPWRTAEGSTDGGVDVRYTTRDGDLYAILMGSPGGREFVINGLVAAPEARATVLADGTEAALNQTEQGLAFRTDSPLDGAPAHALRISPAPEPVAS